MALPVKTTAQDVLNVARYLGTKPTGATPDELKAAAKKVSDGRKLAAFTAWGLIAREEGKIRLTERGRRLNGGGQQQVFLEILDGNRAYRSVLDWLNFNQPGAVTANDVAVHWHENHRDMVGDANDNTLRENAVCFFNIAEAAGLGRMVVGRAGASTRLSVELHALSEHISAGPASPPLSDGQIESEEGQDEANEAEEKPKEDTLPAALPPLTPQQDQMRVFISHGHNTEIVDQISTMLELADIKSEIAIAEETTAIPVPDKVLDAMRRCQAGIIAVTVDPEKKDANGNFTLNENVLIEIGAAFVLYERRVILVWDKRLPVPSNLQGLYRCTFEGDELSWSSGMKLMKAIQNFKKTTPGGGQSA